MKNTKNMLMGLLLSLAVGSTAVAQDTAHWFSEGSTGTLAATVFVREGNRDGAVARVTDWSVAANDTNTYCRVFAGLRQGKVTTASAASSTNILTTFTNGFGHGDYVIVRNGTNSTALFGQFDYQLKQILSVSSTNIGLADTMTSALAVGDPFWICQKPYERRVMTAMQGTFAATNTFWNSSQCEFYLPGRYPSAIMATNAAASQIRISINGIRQVPGD